jgi:hypothetical protein
MSEQGKVANHENGLILCNPEDLHSILKNKISRYGSEEIGKLVSVLSNHVFEMAKFENEKNN